MALMDQELKFLLSARERGVSLEQFCMIGRQTLRIDAGPLRRRLLEAGISLSREETKSLYVEGGGFSEPVLRLLGAVEIQSVDASTYENASIIHDMNQPLPEALEGRFTAVMDGGSLEHVFDFPRAISNCMKMVAVGGHFLGVTPTNNLMGHGFYQFSPELFFRVLNPENGFVMERMVAFEMTPLAAWYEVTDPAQARGRVKLTNRRPTCLLIQARKVARVPLLTVTPQQSDYAAKWDAAKEKTPRYKIKLPLATRLFIRRLRSVFKSPFDPRFFRKVAS